MDQNPSDLDLVSKSLSSAEHGELRKPHEMIVMVPRTKRVTLTGRRIYNVLLHLSQARLAVMDQMPAADYLFEAPLQVILRSTGSSGEDRTAAKRYLKEMRGLEVDWESTAPGDGVKWRGFSMLSEVAIEVRNGQNWVSWSYPPTIMAALRDPKRWARINLDMLASLGSYAAVALYEICARYRDNPSGLTSRKPVAWWVDALGQGAAGSERREWRKIKNERVKPAIEEINSESDLEVELIEHKEGRAVIEAQFAVRKKHAERFKLQPAGIVDANLIFQAEALGIRELKLEDLIKEFGEQAVRKQVTVLQQRTASSHLGAIENAYSYLRSLLRNNGNEDVPDEPTDSRAQAVPTISKQSQINGSPVSTGDHVATAWLNERTRQLKQEIQSLSSEQRQSLVNAVVHEITSKGLMTAVLSRRVAQGDVLHGMIGAWLVRHYASKMYGPDWDQFPASDKSAC